jgi:hypothetical protein
MMLNFKCLATEMTHFIQNHFMGMFVVDLQVIFTGIAFMTNFAFKWPDIEVACTQMHEEGWLSPKIASTNVLK